MTRSASRRYCMLGNKAKSPAGPVARRGIVANRATQNIDRIGSNSPLKWLEKLSAAPNSLPSTASSSAVGVWPLGSVIVGLLRGHVLVAKVGPQILMVTLIVATPRWTVTVPSSVML